MHSYDTEIAEIRSAYRVMRFMQMQRTRIDLAFQAYVRTCVGYSTHLPKSEADPLLKRSQSLIGGEDACDPLYDAIEYARLPNQAAAATFIKIENEKVRQIEKMVDRLPIWSGWGAPIRGLGKKGVGCLIGEAGDIGSYRNEACLWKRMGVGVIDGVAQGKLPNGSPAESWIAHGYNAKRRSVLFQIGDSLVKQGDYRQMYLDRKEVERAKYEAMGFAVKPAGKIKVGEKHACITDMQVHRRAQRYMEKMLLRHMYRAWKRTMVARTEYQEAA
jgi:hypothetical protein